MTEADYDAMRQKWRAYDRPGGTIARDDVFALLDEIDRLNHEVMGYQVDAGYAKGYEHGSLAATKRAAETCRDQSCRVGSWSSGTLGPDFTGGS